MPSFLDELVLRNLQLKQSSVDLKVRRHAHEVSVEILERRGRIQVAVVFGRTATGEMRWYRHLDPLGGPADWAGSGTGTAEGTGWNDSQVTADVTGCTAV